MTARLAMNFSTRHDYTPYFTQKLGAKIGEKVTVRVRTGLPVSNVALSFVEHGEIVERAAKSIAAPATEPTSEEKVRWFEAKLPIISTKMKYCWIFNSKDDTVFLNANGLQRGRRAYRGWFTYLADYNAPEWTWSSVFYQIFPDRFCNGDEKNDVKTGEWIYNGRKVEKVPWGEPITSWGDIHGHYGGDLDGISQKIPYLKDLGVNALWLNPIFESPSNHRYDITNYRVVDPHLGDFDKFMSNCKESDIKIILDGVFNHTGDQCEYFQKAKKRPEKPRKKDVHMDREK